MKKSTNLLLLSLLTFITISSACANTVTPCPHQEEGVPCPFNAESPKTDTNDEVGEYCDIEKHEAAVKRAKELAKSTTPSGGSNEPVGENEPVEQCDPSDHLPPGNS